MESDPEQAIERDIEELDERVDHLEDSLADAKDAAGTQALAGDWEQTDDQAGGEDPVGAHEERDEASEDRGPES